MDGKEFAGTRSEELGTVVNGNGAMSKGYKELSVVAGEGEEVWGPRDRECSLGFKRNFFNTSRRIRGKFLLQV